MKVLVVGNGGREHAIIWKLSQNKSIKKLYCTMGNAGIAALAECINVKPTDIDGIVSFAVKNDIDLTVVAPDDPLAMGLVNALTSAGKRAFGPTKEAAIIEASKSFSKDLMKKYNIPTAQYQTFDNASQALEYLKSVSFPIVIKADGLALGKGVIIAHDLQEAQKAVEDMFINKVFGAAGSKVVIEEFLQGHEATLLCFTDGKTLVPMVSAQDHKPVFDGNQGPNTGGMGVVSPSLHYKKELEQEVYNNILIPTIKAMEKEGRPFKGVLYFGLMITQKGVKVIEYNARFGDPEAQAVLPRLKTDLLDIFNAIIDERLADIKIEWDDRAAITVVLASGGYPKAYKTGYEITGLNDIKDKDIYLFHAGTKAENDKVLTNGGRVMAVTALAGNSDEARKKAYSAVEKISFKDMHYRKDIGLI